MSFRPNQMILDGAYDFPERAAISGHKEDLWDTLRISYPFQWLNCNTITSAPYLRVVGARVGGHTIEGCIFRVV